MSHDPNSPEALIARGRRALKQFGCPDPEAVRIEYQVGKPDFAASASQCGADPTWHYKLVVYSPSEEYVNAATPD
jgi:hypothetical protein